MIENVIRNVVNVIDKYATPLLLRYFAFDNTKCQIQKKGFKTVH